MLLTLLCLRKRNLEWYIKDSDAAQHADMLESARQFDLITNTSERR